MLMELETVMSSLPEGCDVSPPEGGDEPSPPAGGDSTRRGSTVSNDVYRSMDLDLDADDDTGSCSQTV